MHKVSFPSRRFSGDQAVKHVFFDCGATIFIDSRKSRQIHTYLSLLNAFLISYLRLYQYSLQLSIENSSFYTYTSYFIHIHLILDKETGMGQWPAGRAFTPNRSRMALSLTNRMDGISVIGCRWISSRFVVSSRGSIRPVNRSMIAFCGIARCRWFSDSSG